MRLQRFFFLVLLLRQQAFLLGDFCSERPTITTIAIKTQVFMFRSQRVNSTRKFTVVVEIVTLLNLCCFVSALFSRNENKYTRNLNLPPFWRLFVSMEMVQTIPTRTLSRVRGVSMRSHLTAVLILPPCPSNASRTAETYSKWRL